MTIRCEQGTEMGKNARHVLGVQMMQETIHQDEVKSILGGGGIVAHVGDDEFAAVTLAGIADIALVEVDTDVIGVSEVMSVGSRTDKLRPAHAESG